MFLHSEEPIIISCNETRQIFNDKSQASSKMVSQYTKGYVTLRQTSLVSMKVQYPEVSVSMHVFMYLAELSCLYACLRVIQIMTSPC